MPEPCIYLYLGKSFSKFFAQKHKLSLRHDGWMALIGSYRGVYPPTTMALFPAFSRLTPPPSAPPPLPQTIVGYFIRNFVRVLSEF